MLLSSESCNPKFSIYSRTVRSLLQSLFSSSRPDRIFQTGPYFSDRTAVPIIWTVRSGSFRRSPKKATVRTGPDHGQSTRTSPLDSARDARIPRAGREFQFQVRQLSPAQEQTPPPTTPRTENPNPPPDTFPKNPCATTPT